MDKENNKGIRREIFWYYFGEQDGSVQKGYRPVIVLQDNIINSYSDTVIVAPLTGVIKKPYWFSHLLIGNKFGLSLPSMILMEQITTVNQTGLGDYIGIVNEKSVNKAIRISLIISYAFYISFSRSAVYIISSGNNIAFSLFKIYSVIKKK